MKRLLLTFDVEEVDWGPPPTFGRDSTDPSAEGIDRVLPVLERISVRATFFCTGLFAKRRPERIRRIAEWGHEIASHGWEHRDDYGRLSPSVAIDRLRNSRRLLEDITGREVHGVRTPRLSACPAKLLAGSGFSYDASHQPSWVRRGLRGLRMPRGPWEQEGILHVPLSVVPVIRLPVAWYVLRLAGAGTTGALARLAGAGTPFVHLYFHPWEAAVLDSDLARHPLGWRAGPAWIRPFETLVSQLARNYVPESVGEFVAAWRTRRAHGPA